MKNIDSRKYQINGDGNAIGNDNNVVIIKKELHTHNHKSAGNSTDDENPAGLVIGAGLAIAIALAALSYFFALHSSEIYLGATVIGGIEVLAALVSTCAVIYYEEYEFTPKCLVVLALSTIATVITFTATKDFSGELMNVAQQASGFKEFWCRLSPYGAQMASRHALVTSFALLPSLLLLIPQVINVAVSIFGKEMNTNGIVYFLGKFTSWPAILLTAFLVGCAMYGHSKAGADAWTNQLKSPPRFFCPQ